jgi:hypothetical protein
MTAEVSGASREGVAVRRALVVLGMHRSGTSAMTRTLSLLGAALPQSLPAAGEDNPTGFWEPWPVALLNDEILQALDSEWDDVFAFRPRHYLSNFDNFYLGRAVDLLEQEFNGSEVIALKDPRISVLTSFWDRALQEAGFSAHYIIMVRNPLEVAESLRARNGFPREKSLLLWSSYMIAADRDTRDRERTFVSYDQLMDDWRAVRERIEAGAGFPLPRNTAAAAIDIDRFLDRKLRHHQAAPADLFSRSDVPEDIKGLYRIFSEACVGADVDRAAVDAIGAELGKVDLLVGPLLADLRASARRLSKEVAELESAHAAARDRADTLDGQLEEERQGRQAEAEAASETREELERRSNERAEQAAAAEAERDRLAAEVEAKAAKAAQLDERLSGAEAERDRLAAEVEAREGEAVQLRESLSVAEAERDRLAAEVEARAAKAAQLDERLSEAEAEHERFAAEAQQLRGRQTVLQDRFDDLSRQLRTAEAAVGEAQNALRAKDAEGRATQQRLSKAEAETASVRQESERSIDRLRQESEREIHRVRQESEREIDRVKTALTGDVQAATEARNKADIGARANEIKLKQRFQEVATLTNLLREREQSSELANEHAGWLLALNQRLGEQPRWWTLLPKSWGRRRTLRLLREAGLFDGNAYVQRYPDVAAARRDPLEHYLEYGYHEGRLRKL